MNSKPYKFLLLDDHCLFLDGIELLLKNSYKNCEITKFSSVKALKENINNFSSFHLLISDIEIPDEDTISFLEFVKEAHKTPVLVISMHKKLSVINQCKAMEIDGYILKNDAHSFATAIEKLLQGGVYYSCEVLELINDVESHNVILSKREEEVLKYYCLGYSNQEIADLVYVSIETIKTHKKNIKTKLGTNKTHEIITYAKNHMLI